MSTETKTGVKTSEFWTMLIGGAGSALIALAADKPWAAAIFGVASVALPVIYIWGRAVLKAEQAKQTDIIPDKFEPALNAALNIVKQLSDIVVDADNKKKQDAEDND